MKVSCIQMNMAFAKPEENFLQAEALIRQTVQTEQPDTLVLPETWNTGFFPREDLKQHSDRQGERTLALLSSLARELQVNIVGGSIANDRGDAVTNTCYVFDRQGACVGEYDKTHAFTPMGEHEYFRQGDRLSTFVLDGLRCGVIICYDLRFPELTRALALTGLDVLFIVAQWPAVRLAHLQLLATARAVENQMFTVCCNSCGTAGETVYGGGSQIVDPWGTVLARAGSTQQILSAQLDETILAGIRSSIHVFRDRRPELYPSVCAQDLII